MPLNSRTIFITFLLLLAAVPSVQGGEIETKYTTVVYENDKQLRDFNNELRFGRRFSFFSGRKQEITETEELSNKVDAVVTKVQRVLEMFPNTLHFKIQVLASASEVRKVYQRRYRQKSNFIAFYSPRDKTIFISAKNADLRVFAHEVAHVVIHHYFNVAPTSKIHEVLARYAEDHITD